jgi:hypothetical protein
MMPALPPRSSFSQPTRRRLASVETSPLPCWNFWNTSMVLCSYVHSFPIRCTLQLTQLLSRRFTQPSTLGRCDGQVLIRARFVAEWTTDSHSQGKLDTIESVVDNALPSGHEGSLAMSVSMSSMFEFCVEYFIDSIFVCLDIELFTLFVTLFSIPHN